MSKSLVGKVKNKNFAFFWLLIGGSLGNILITILAPAAWIIFLPPAILSILIAIIMSNKTKRPKFWLALDILLTIVLFIVVVPVNGSSQINLGVFLPGLLIILGCVLGIMNW